MTSNLVNIATNYFLTQLLQNNQTIYTRLTKNKLPVYIMFYAVISHPFSILSVYVLLFLFVDNITSVTQAGKQ